MKHLYLCVVLCLLLVNTCTAASWAKSTGQPGCQTDEELSVGTYRHFYKKNQYWVCHTLGTPASLALCPIGHAWLDEVKDCVPYSQWYYTPTVAPPSAA